MVRGQGGGDQRRPGVGLWIHHGGTVEWRLFLPPTRVVVGREKRGRIGQLTSQTVGPKRRQGRGLRERGSRLWQQSHNRRRRSEIVDWWWRRWKWWTRSHWGCSCWRMIWSGGARGRGARRGMRRRTR
ncbi:unnamed protein product [Linum trigynum]|uniref:Uncharacterized protein n=1 Tax=Linum trigynum TaxID=586398 RepID=A0AAV2CWP6_9ROSI